MENEQLQIRSESTPVRNAALDYALSDEMLSSNLASTEDIIARAESRQQSGRAAADASRIANETRIENDAYFRQEDFLRDASANRMAMREGRGMATSVAQFQVFDETVNAQLRDIQRVKQEALTQNNALYAQQLANLELETLQMRMQATQQSFQNILGLAGLGLQQQDFDLRLRGQEFQEDSAIGAIALEFGLDVADGETIDSIVSRAAPLADESRRLQLDQIRAQIAHTRAQSAELARAARDRASLKSHLANMNPDDKAVLIAQGQLTMDMMNSVGDSDGLSIMAGVLRQNTAGTLMAEVEKMTGTTDEKIDTLKARYNGQGYDAYIADIQSVLVKEDEARAKRKPTSLPGLFKDARNLAGRGIAGTARFITGYQDITYSPFENRYF